MRDKFVFSNSQDLGSLDSTGVISTDFFDLEEDATTDMMQMGWLNVLILSTTNTGGAEGIDIQLRSDDNVNHSAAPIYLGCIKLLQASILAAAMPGAWCVGVCRAALKRYIAVWYKADTSSLNGATLVDAWWSEQPISVTGIQKKPVASTA